MENRDELNNELKMTSNFKKMLDIDDDDDCNIDPEEQHSDLDKSPSKFTIN